MDRTAKKSLNRLLKKEDQPVIEIKDEPSKSGIIKTEIPEKEVSKIEKFISNARQKKKEHSTKASPDDEALTPYQEQRKRQRQTEQADIAKLQQAKKRVKKEEESSDQNVPKQHLPQDSILETNVIGNPLPPFPPFSLFRSPSPFFLSRLLLLQYINVINR